ncbi:MAG: hypothetical protein KAY24_10310, partial [Candidatus Eisenbacteria sp.]|nr:hypothetical protein [Candidatus Eisenbacteria bacterium]
MAAGVNDRKDVKDAALSSSNDGCVAAPSSQCHPEQLRAGYVRSLVQKDAVLERLKPGGIFSFIRSKPKPIKLELIYFPYYLFKISLAVEGGKREISIASDGILGSLAFLETQTLDLLESVNAPRFSFQIQEERARERVLNEYTWILVKHGFHRKNPPRVVAIAPPERFYYPYWIAYYDRS